MLKIAAKNKLFLQEFARIALSGGFDSEDQLIPAHLRYKKR